MGIAGGRFLILCVALAVTVTGIAVFAWKRRRRIWVVAATIVASQLALVFASAIAVNREFGLYANWNDVLGIHPPGAYQDRVVAGRLDGAIRIAGTDGNGRLRVSWQRLHEHGCGFASVPRSYAGMYVATRRFPVIMTIGPFPARAVPRTAPVLVVRMCSAGARAYRTASTTLGTDRSGLDRAFRTYPVAQGWALVGAFQEAWSALGTSIRDGRSVGVVGLVEPDPAGAAAALRSLPRDGCTLRVVVSEPRTDTALTQVWHRLRGAGCRMTFVPARSSRLGRRGTDGAARATVAGVTRLMPPPLAPPIRVRSIRLRGGLVEAARR
ncbi:MAG: hypothetical protein ACR2F6_19365 [Mycobacteriales bacterium]